MEGKRGSGSRERDIGEKKRSFVRNPGELSGQREIC